MYTLFSSEPEYPPGFFYTEDFLTLEEEMELCRTIQQIELHNLQFQGYEAKRRIASFGYDWSFENKILTKGKPIPKAFDAVIDRLCDQCNIDKDKIAELLVTEYPVGSVINWHRDAPPFDVIAGISLLADCNFKLRPHDKEKQNRKSIVSFTAKRRSLYSMSGVARAEWQHSIAPVNQVRYSITVRTLKQTN